MWKMKYFLNFEILPLEFDINVLLTHYIQINVSFLIIKTHFYINNNIINGQ